MRRRDNTALLEMWRMSNS